MPKSPEKVRDHVQIKKRAESFEKMKDILHKDLGVNYDSETPYAYIGKSRWNVKPPIKSVTDILLDTQDEYQKSLEKLGEVHQFSPEHMRVYEKSTKKILEASLEKFVYATEANNPECGPALLGHLAEEVKVFLVGGGTVGMRRLRTLSNTMSGI